MKRVLLALCFVLTLPMATFSHAQSQAVDQQLASAMDTLIAATVKRDIEGIMAFTPPRKMQAIADDMGQPLAQAKIALADIGRQQDASRGIRVLRGSYDLNGAQFGTTPTGRHYAFLTYARLFEHGDKQLEMVFPTLAFMDEGQWYVVPLSDDSILTDMKQLYPDLANVSIPAAMLPQKD